MRPDYGIDAAPVVRNLGVIGGLCLILAIVSYTIAGDTFLRYWKYSFLSTGVSLIIAAVLMVLYAKYGKFRHRDRMLNMIDWRGDEMVLDVGTGRGLLMIGAAKRLQSGRATGIDIWNKEDLSGNNVENAMRNAELEGVASQVEIKEEDARKMSFPDASFDVVLSNLCIHNIPDAGGRRAACAEIARVLKPAGIALISDFKNTAQYRREFESLGLNSQLGPRHFFDTFPPLSILMVRKGRSKTQSRET